MHVTRGELRAILDFVDQVRGPSGGWTGAAARDPLWSMVAYLMRRYLEDRLVTVSSLADAAGVPHATAMRRIDELFAEGLLVRRARTRTGRSFSIHPSPLLIERFQAMAQHVKQLCGRSFGLAPGAGYRFGASYMAASIIPDPAPPALPDGAPGPIRLLVNDEPIYLVIERIRPALERLSGRPLLLRIETLDRLREVTLRDAHRRISGFDIVAVDLPWIGEYAQLGVLQPLDRLIDDSQINKFDFHPAAWEACQARAHQYAVPLQPMPELLFCRADLLARHGLPPPATTDQTLAAARLLTDHDRGRAGIAWNGARGTPVGQTFVQLLGAFGSPPLALRRIGDDFDPTDLDAGIMRPLIDTPAGHATLDYMKALLPYSVPDVLGSAWDATIRAFAERRAAMVYAWTDRAAAFFGDASATGSGQVMAVPHPRGPAGRNVSPVGGSVLAIPARIAPERLPLAAAMIAWLTSPALEKLYIRNGSLASARFSVSADPEVRQHRPLIGVVDELARQGRLTTWQRPAVPEFSRLIGVLGTEIHEALSGGKPAAAALASAQSRIDLLMREQGRY